MMGQDASETARVRASRLRASPKDRPASRLPRMRVLVFHGYLLHGTGSNVYNARLAAGRKRSGWRLTVYSSALPWIFTA